MVSKNNTRVMITISNKYLNNLKDICDLEGLSLSQYIKELIIVDLVERSKLR